MTIDFKDPGRALPNGLTWYAIKTKPQREAKAADWLEQHTETGAFTLTPLETIIRKSNRRGGKDRQRPTKIQQVPWIPRIVFCGFSRPVNWLQIASCYQITGWIGTDFTPISIPHAEIAHLHRLSAELLRDPDAYVPRQRKPLVPGSLARLIKLGVFQGHAVKVISATDDRVVYELNMLGSPRRIRGRLDDLEAMRD